MHAVIEAKALTIDAPGGRRLFADLSLSLTQERVALVGRNGAGKSTLLSVLAGHELAKRGRVIRRGSVELVPQVLSGAGSPGEVRKAALVRAKRARPDLLLLDEPTQDLDARGVAWLTRWVARWRGALVVVSHDPRLLASFEAFFVVSESGCWLHPGSFASLETRLEEQRRQRELAYAAQLRRLADKEARLHKVRQSRTRKRNRGRMNEVDRCPGRLRLNTNRSYAQESQGRRFGALDSTLSSARDFALAARRALTLSLPLRLVPPTLPADVGATVQVGPLVVGPRDRVGVVGPNGSGKTTLLEGLVAAAPADRTAMIGQGVVEATSATLVQRLSSHAPTPEAVADLIVSHGFPLALAQRPLRSLSPGERARAALIACWRREPPVELLVLDEPTEHLDFEGRRALLEALVAWPGALVIASHDEAFLGAIGVREILTLGGQTPSAYNESLLAGPSTHDHR